MFMSGGEVYGWMKRKKQVEAVEEVLPQLCPKCRRLVKEALLRK